MSSLQKFHRRTQPFVVNTLHTGTVSISGTATVGSLLTATNNIADVDGLGTFAYQWKRSGSAISGATSSTYTLVAADNGNTITVTITYTDSKGFTESETSAATSSVITPKTIGSGSATTGYYLGKAGDGTSYMYVAPRTTETSKTWGSYGTNRGTGSTTDGLANTNTLSGFGQTAHPAAYYCKNLTTGGYNTWYLPAKDELNTIYTSRNAAPFTNNDYFGGYTTYWTSTEGTQGNYLQNSWFAWYQNMSNGSQGYGNPTKKTATGVRAVRRSTI